MMTPIAQASEVERLAGPLDPLYTAAVPDTTYFQYNRDTPIVPMATPVGMVRESLPPGAFMDAHAALPPHLRSMSPQAQPAPGGKGSQGGSVAQQFGAGGQPLPPAAAPWNPMYSVLPLIREDAHMAVSSA